MTANEVREAANEAEVASVAAALVDILNGRVTEFFASREQEPPQTRWEMTRGFGTY
jgi:hypothetical protein